MNEREAFEAWITAPPFEKDIHRGDENSDWPGAYTDYRVHLAWDAWQARTALADAERARVAKRCAEIARGWVEGEKIAQDIEAEFSGAK